jgi:hypothetical protein
LAFPQELGENVSLDEPQGEEGPAVGGAQLVDRYQAGVLQLAADPRLLNEAADDFGLALVLVQEHFEGEVASEVGVAAQEHRAHASPPNFAAHLVTSEVRQGRRAAVLGRGSGGGREASTALRGAFPWRVRSRVARAWWGPSGNCP